MRSRGGARSALMSLAGFGPRILSANDSMRPALSRIRKPAPASSDNPKIASHKVERGGTTYTMNTARRNSLAVAVIIVGPNTAYASFSAAQRVAKRLGHSALQHQDRDPESQPLLPHPGSLTRPTPARTIRHGARNSPVAAPAPERLAGFSCSELCAGSAADKIPFGGRSPSVHSRFLAPGARADRGMA